jgi:hypothetical protein
LMNRYDPNEKFRWPGDQPPADQWKTDSPPLKKKDGDARLYPDLDKAQIEALKEAGGGM